MRPIHAILPAAGLALILLAPASAQNNVVEIAPPAPAVTIPPAPLAEEPAEEPPSPDAAGPESAPAGPASVAPPPMEPEVLPVSPDAPYPEGFADPVDPYAEDMGSAWGDERDGFNWGLLGLLGLFGLLGLRRR